MFCLELNRRSALQLARGDDDGCGEQSAGVSRTAVQHHRVISDSHILSKNCAAQVGIHTQGNTTSVRFAAR